MGWADMRRSAVQLEAFPENVAHPCWRECAPRSSRRLRRCVRLDWRLRAARRSEECGCRLTNPTYLAIGRQDLPDSTDRVCFERRVSKPHRPADPCPWIIPPSCKSIVFLLSFAMCMAFPCSDYYESSVLGLVRFRSSRLAQFRAGQASRVPVFRSSTFVPLGSELYPLQLWRWAEESRSHLECDDRIHQRGT